MTTALESNTQKVMIDGTEYALNELSNEAKNQILNLRVTDQEITQLQQKLAIAQTARATYAKALAAELPKAKTEH